MSFQYSPRKSSKQKLQYNSYPEDNHQNYLVSINQVCTVSCKRFTMLQTDLKTV